MYTSIQKQAILNKVNLDAINASVWTECKIIDENNIIVNKQNLLKYIQDSLIYKEYIILIQDSLKKELTKIPHSLNCDGLCEIDIIIDAIQLREHNGKSLRSDTNVR